MVTYVERHCTITYSLGLHHHRHHPKPRRPPRLTNNVELLDIELFVLLDVFIVIILDQSQTTR